MQSYNRNSFCIVFRFKYNRRTQGGKAHSRIMEDLIKEIYDNKMEKSKWNRTDYEIEKEIRDLLQHEEEHLPPEEYETCRCIRRHLQEKRKDLPKGSGMESD